jgi:hypothetical protein
MFSCCLVEVKGNSVQLVFKRQARRGTLSHLSGETLCPLRNARTTTICHTRGLRWPSISGIPAWLKHHRGVPHSILSLGHWSLPSPRLPSRSSNIPTPSGPSSG